MDEDRFREQLIRRIDVVISLLLDLSDREGKQTMTAKVERLKTYGLRTSEIGSIVGRDAGYVSATLAMAKKAKKRRKAEKKGGAR